MIVPKLEAFNPSVISACPKQDFDAVVLCLFSIKRSRCLVLSENDFRSK